MASWAPRRCSVHDPAVMKIARPRRTGAGPTAFAEDRRRRDQSEDAEERIVARRSRYQLPLRELQHERRDAVSRCGGMLDQKEVHVVRRTAWTIHGPATISARRCEKLRDERTASPVDLRRGLQDADDEPIRARSRTAARQQDGGLESVLPDRKDGLCASGSALKRKTLDERAISRVHPSASHEQQQLDGNEMRSGDSIIIATTSARSTRRGR